MGWLSGWDKRIKLTIDQTKVDTANQSNFPVLVYVSAASGIGDVDVSCIFDELTSDGNRKKIAITTSDGTTECYVEIEKWDDANEKAWLWVKVPTVAHAVDTDLYLYYDVDHADNTTYIGDTTDAVTHNVWDSNFIGVWHMAQDPDGDTANVIKDSTSNGRDGTPYGTMLTADLVDGKIGKAIDFDGTDDSIRCTGVTLDQSTGLTLEAVIKVPAALASSKYLVINQQAGDAVTANILYLSYVDPNLYLSCYITSSDVSRIGAYQADIDRDTFISVTGVYKGDQVAPDVYKNGIDVTNSDTNGTGIDITNDTGYVCISGRSYDNTRNFHGIEDEVRISNIDRSAPWLKATHHSNFDSLITFGSEEAVTTGLFDGKVCISPTTLIFDGKAIVKDSITDQFDGRSIVALVGENEFDGKTRVEDVTTLHFDGKTVIKDTATGLFDGELWLYPARNLFDGKIWVKELIEGSIDLPSLDITGNTGAIGNLTLPFFEVLGEVSVGIDAQGSLTLPGLGVAGFTGAKCNYNLPSLGVSGTSVVGIAASGDVVLPIFNVDGQAFIDALVHGVFTLPALNVVASSIAGALCIGEVTLPSLGVSATAKVGIICTGAMTLPCLIVEGTGGHVPIGNGDVTLPLLQVYSTASKLADPRDGCHVLRYNRWR